MKPSSAKAKGRTFQQLIRDKLRAHFALGRDDIRSTSMGASGEDLLLSPHARSLFPYSVECKSLNKIVVYNWLEQRAGDDYAPIVFAKANHKQPIVIMYLEDFLELIKETNGTEATETK